MSFPITAVIVNHALCPDCIAHKVGVEPETVETAIRVMSSGGMKIDRYANGTCVECRTERLVYAIDQP